MSLDIKMPATETLEDRITSYHIQEARNTLRQTGVVTPRYYAISDNIISTVSAASSTPSSEPTF